MTRAATSQRSSWSRAILAATCSVSVSIDAPPAHARGVDQHVLAPAERERRVDRIARRPRLVVHQHPLLAEQAVDQRRLADVGLAHEGDARRGGRVVRRGVAAARARRGRRSSGSFGRRPRRGARSTPRPWLAETREHLGEAEREGLGRPPRSRLRAVDLVGGEQHRLAGLAQQLAPPRCRPAVMPSRASTTNTTRSASSSARSVCWRIAPRIPVAERIEAAGVDDAESAPAPSRDRRSGDRGSRRARPPPAPGGPPTRRLNSDDLPTLGRPISETSGSASSSAPRRRSWRRVSVARERLGGGRPVGVRP